ncbi:hypothetical protein Pmar_PMAR017530 [Perkinsus marinus ATCC 50983]|uniref:Uncharacterized protein n=1 Tax=Perkinsus marinus (strain ATCC 50983 / TXsc) TaxID=423536 RepID=C5KVG8_PERM5|nr:hypothetical protein Pmar_PMAR017530 [Perkinsus marinus ATCC 50983]EER11525.1 hypothetical protein Pmar_PMAR017530 [Perkinsus marinus ATCC 50983]|eukprot:XP_002779730.1 hypothetical protein Pmar_PMAR017530 [Perkinsus marinus ATCC 50983]
MMTPHMICLMACYVLVFVGALPAGRYVHEGQGYRLTYVFTDSRIGLEFEVKGQAPFVDPPIYPLKRIAEAWAESYFVDFEGSPEGVDYWYRGIRHLFPEVEIASADLTRVVVYPYDSSNLLAKFQDQVVDFFAESA